MGFCFFFALRLISTILAVLLAMLRFRASCTIEVRSSAVLALFRIRHRLAKLNFMQTEISQRIWQIHQNSLNQAKFKGVDESGKIFYHYTTFDAAVNIIQHNTLRFTDARFVNDPTELIDAVALFEKISREAYEISDPKKIYSPAIYSLRFALLTGFTPKSSRLEILKKLEQESVQYNLKFTPDQKRLMEVASTAFVFCASENPRSLYQWRAYANDACGIALGFNSPNRNLEWDLCNSARYTNVAYEKDLQKEEYLKLLLKNCLEYLFELYQRYPGDLKPYTIWYNILYDLFTIDIVACKNEVYFPEEEHRAYFIKHIEKQQDYTDVSFIESRGLVKPSIIKNFNKEYLVDVVLGPKCNPLNKDSLQMLLIANGYNNAKVSQCDIPYR
jgi:hypothetical protein